MVRTRAVFNPLSAVGTCCVKLEHVTVNAYSASWHTHQHDCTSKLLCCRRPHDSEFTSRGWHSHMKALSLLSIKLLENQFPRSMALFALFDAAHFLCMYHLMGYEIGTGMIILTWCHLCAACAQLVCSLCAACVQLVCSLRAACV